MTNHHRLLADAASRLERRVFLLVGWGRWLATVGRALEVELSAVVEERARRGLGRATYSGATPRGSFGIAVDDDACARRWQQIQHQLARARVPFHGAHHVIPRRDVERAAEARALEKDVLLYLAPSDPDDRELWLGEVDWWRAPESYCVQQDQSDGSYSIIGVSSAEIREQQRVAEDGLLCEWPECSCAVSFPDGRRPSAATECPAIDPRDDSATLRLLEDVDGSLWAEWPTYDEARGG